MQTVLILNGEYLPGYKGGGPIQSCVNMVENLCDDFHFKILCSDRDNKDEEPYPDIKINDWNQVGHANVYYMSPDRQTTSGFQEILNHTEYDILYLNGFFSPTFTIKPLLLRSRKKLKKTKVILCPRGDFTGGLENKKLKKYGYIAATKLIGMYRNLLWHTTSELEEQDLKRIFPKAKTFLVPNLPAKFVEKKPQITKTPGTLRLVFVSRIFPKKNIKYALDVLKQIHEGKIIFDIYGPMEDKSYWAECEKLMEEMPQNVAVNYCGEVTHDKIPQIFAQYHAFFFPTLGENYGHVIVEAMMNNCLCILSKGVTPWDEYIYGLDIGAPLSNKDQFVEIIKRLLWADQSEISRMLAFNNDYVRLNTQSENDIEKYREMFGKS